MFFFLNFFTPVSGRTIKNVFFVSSPPSPTLSLGFWLTLFHKCTQKPVQDCDYYPVRRYIDDLLVDHTYYMYLRKVKGKLAAHHWLIGTKQTFGYKCIIPSSRDRLGMRWGPLGQNYRNRRKGGGGGAGWETGGGG